MPQYVTALTCRDQPGIVRALAQGIVDLAGNIVESAQFSDSSTESFCVRTRFETDEPRTQTVYDILLRHLSPYVPELRVRRADQRSRALIMVSKPDHCLADLLYRWEAGELPIDIPLIVSNHRDLEGMATRAGIPFVHLPVRHEGGTADKRSAELRLFELIDMHRVDLVVLARYMQVLSDDACARLEGRAINIHHSFLPGFKGARPYFQAYERGVKLIGATAHYVTAQLDEGPIIEQDVVRVTHAHSPAALAAVGRDVERLVLARAVRLHAEDRVFLTGRRTVVFP